MPKTTVEECVSVDINEFQRKGALRPGERAIKSVSFMRAGKIISTDTVAVVGTKEGALLVNIKQDQNGKITKRFFPISVVWAPFGHGGTRPYFICPGAYQPCDRRVIKLYKPPSAEFFACRHCYNLTYLSRNVSDPQGLAELRTKRAARKLGLADPKEVWTMERPKRMHRDTFERLRQAVIDALEGEEDAFDEALEKKSVALADLCNISHSPPRVPLESFHRPRIRLHPSRAHSEWLSRFK